MPDLQTCTECGSPIPENAREGYCPKCLLALAQTAAAETRDSLTVLPSSCGSAFGNYQLIEQIGEGGMGVVYKARQQTLNRTVALKMMRSGSLASDSEVRRFRSEAQAAAKLQHPNVVAIHEVGEQDGRLYFSMDYIEGRSLAQVVQRTPLAPERAARYVKTIAEATHYAHQHGILHRDLKPSNILIDANDQPRITDFGLAKQIEIDSDLTVSGAILGTPSYMPPEQAQGRRQQIGPASEVYSLGAILYDCLTGRPPFRADTPVDTLRQVLETEPAAPRLLNRKVPRDLETICLKCLAKSPGKRYPSAQELADDLNRFLLHEPIQARPISSLARAVRWCRRHPAVAVPLAAVGLLLLSVSVGVLLFTFKLEEQLRLKTLKENHILAGRVAEQVRVQFVKWSLEVEQIAKREELRQRLLLQEREYQSTPLSEGESEELRRRLIFRDQEGLQALIQELVNREHNGAQDQASAFQSWYVEDDKGYLLGVLPVNDSIIGHKYDGRDYFRGAMKHSEHKHRDLASVHISKVFKSDNDGFYKFALSAPVYAGTEPDARVLGIVAATVTTSSTLGSVSLDDERSKAVLVGRWDTNPSTGPSNVTGKDRYLILLHPEIKEAGKEEIEVRNQEQRLRLVHQPQHEEELETNAPPSVLQLEQSVDPDYKDPLRPNVRWLAAFAPVGRTECVIIIQTPYEEVRQLVRQLNGNLFQYLAISGGSVLGFAAALGGTAALISLLRSRRERESR